MIGDIQSTEFLNLFIKDEGYLQNPPKNVSDFSKFAEKMGIKVNAENLEFLEKEGLLFPLFRMQKPVIEEETIEFVDQNNEKRWRFARDGLQNGEKETGRSKARFYSRYGFHEKDQKLLMNWLEEELIFPPKLKPFSDWKTHRGEQLENGNEAIESFYSSFQILWLEEIINALRLEINFAFIPITKFQEAHITKAIQRLENHREQLIRERGKFEKYEMILLLLQNAYFPHVRSGGKTLTLHGDMNKWHEKRNNFNLHKTLEMIGGSLEEVAELYSFLCRKAKELLCLEWHSDLLQLWKNIDWMIKDRELKGKQRRGIEYLQWAVMIKTALEHAVSHKILDVDEISGVPPNLILQIEADILEYDTSYDISNRGGRNLEFFDSIENKDYYYHSYKRLFYLANKLGIDYQPRVMVFVEGQSEIDVLTSFFEWVFGNPEHHGIQFYNFSGVNNIFGTEITWRNKSDERLKKFVSNFSHLISYNLQQWQIIPFIIADNEKGLGNLLLDSIVLRFEGDQKVPKQWQYIWGRENRNYPLVGNSFELSNFTNREIVAGLKNELGMDKSENDIEALRTSGKGLNELLPKEFPSGHTKPNLAISIFKEFQKNYQSNSKAKENKRPIFDLFDRIMRLSSLNHPPIHRVAELQNKFDILKEFKA